MTNLFVRKKKVKGRWYYYAVQSTRLGSDKWKKVERYIGLNPPSKKEIEGYKTEFDRIKQFLSEKGEELEKIRRLWLDKKKNATKDEIMKLEESVIIKFTYDTNRIEGSSLSYKDTKMLLQDGIAPREKPMRDIKEAENHRKAFIFMKESLPKEINRELILGLHRILKESVTEDAGKFRDAQVRVGDLVPIKADMVETEMENLLKWHKKNRNLHALELAAVFHCIFERIHPFFDGNGRVGRLLLNHIFLKKGYPVVIVQNRNKRRYYNALKRADDGNYLYMIKYLFDELKNQIKDY